MSASKRIVELILQWQDLREQGQVATPEQICAQTPELLDEFKERIQGIALLASLPGDRSQTDSKNVASTLDYLGHPRTLPQTPASLPGYEILGILGNGGMGVVYKARQQGLNRIVALKMIKSGNGASIGDIQRFRTEAEAVASLQHPNIVQIHAIGEHEGLPFFSLEYCAGGSLAKKQSGTPLPPREAAILVETLARAMHVAHEHGILHRDLKPANILLTDTGAPKIADFGLAKKLDDDTGQTQAGAAMGSPSYMAPEQAEGRTEAFGPATDVYALGAILYELLTGRPPFKGTTVLETLDTVRSQEPVAVRLLQPKTPRDLETICLKCLHKQPDRRYTSARDLADDLERFMANAPILARPVGKLERAAWWARRHPTTCTLVIAAFLALVAGAVGLAAYDRQMQNERTRGLVERLTTADTSTVPALLAELEPIRSQAAPLLRQVLNEAAPHSRARFHAAWALITDAPEESIFLAGRLLESDPDDVLLLRKALRPHADGLLDVLWEATGDQTPARRLRAGAALADFAPDDVRWKRLGPELTAALLREPTLLVGKWVEALRPARSALTPALADIFRNRTRSESERNLAASVLADYVADRPDMLAELVLDASPDQYIALAPRLVQVRDGVRQRLHAELARVEEQQWLGDASANAWPNVDPFVVQSIEKAGGLVFPSLAFCQQLHPKDVEAVTTAMARAGYRPTQLRPFRMDVGVRVAILWTRDGRDWRLETDATADAWRSRDAVLRQDGFMPTDIAVFVSPTGKPRYAGVWLRPAAAHEESRVGIDISDKEVGTPPEDRFVRRVLQGIVLDDGSTVTVDLRTRQLEGNPRCRCESMLSLPKFGKNVERGMSLVGLTVSAAPTIEVQRAAAVQRWTELCSAVDIKPGDEPFWLEALAWPALRLGQDAAALTVIDKGIERLPRMWQLYYFRSVLKARLGDHSGARQDAARYRQLFPGGDAVRETWCRDLDARRLARAGNERGALELVEAQPRRPDTALNVYHAAGTHATLARLRGRNTLVQAADLAGLSGANAWAALTRDVARRQQTSSLSEEELLSRAVALLDEAGRLGQPLDVVEFDPDFSGVTERADFRSMLARRPVNSRFSGCWSADHDVDHWFAIECTTAAQLLHAHKLAGQGFRLASVSVAQARAGDPPHTAFLWHQPRIGDGQRDASAARQANAAVALVQLGDAHSVWPLLRFDPAPRRRSAIIQRLAAFRTDPKVVAERLQFETDVSARRALVLALGEFGDADLPPPRKKALTESLLEEYRTHPDSGLHSAIGWLLRHRWGQSSSVAGIDRDLVGKPPGERDWYVNAIKQTMAVVKGPVEIDTEKGRRQIPRSFAIGAREVTSAEFQLFLNESRAVEWDFGQHQDPIAPSHDAAILGPSWFIAARFCNWLSHKDGILRDQWCFPDEQMLKPGMVLPADYLSRTGYRLPTATEWELAARAGTITSRYFGSADNLLDRYAWTQEVARGRLGPAGSLRPNDFGLFDTLGGVTEWCMDRDTQKGGTVDREDGHLVVEADHHRIMVGGSFYDPASVTRFGRFQGYKPASINTWIGFRVARTMYSFETASQGVFSARRNSLSHERQFSARKTYVLEMESTAFDTFLIVTDAAGKKIAENDDIAPNNLNSRIVFTPPADGVYRIIATSFGQHRTGAYTLRIREVGGK